MKIVSWNINGINSSIRDGILDFIKKDDADIYCFQEVKSDPKAAIESEVVKGKYHAFWHAAKKKGYSGLLVLTKQKPLAIIEGIGNWEFDDEGRFQALEYDDFVLVNTYFPNSREGLSRLEFKMKFNEEYLEFMKKLEKETKKPLIMTGDFNVAHKEIDLANPKANEKNAGFSIQEREWFTKLLESGFVDTFREFDKSAGKYTWWTYRFGARARNIGWRIDYFVVSKKFMSKIKKSYIMPEIKGSDHAVIVLEI
ncbi:MAG: exodeoxyribonuclease III [Nanoarchaeota archaeon]